MLNPRDNLFSWIFFIYCEILLLPIFFYSKIYGIVWHISATVSTLLQPFIIVIWIFFVDLIYNLYPSFIPHHFSYPMTISVDAF